MDKRYTPLPLPEQMTLRRQAIETALAHPQRSLAETLRQIRTTLRLTVPEFARLAKLSARTLQDIEAGRSAGTVQSVQNMLAVVGLELGVQRRDPPKPPAP